MEKEFTLYDFSVEFINLDGTTLTVPLSDIVETGIPCDEEGNEMELKSSNLRFIYF
jgi:hypothetical protein